MRKQTTPSAKWNAAEYAANSTVQQSWARELIAKLNLRGNEKILDVGCGDGKVTAEIAKAVPNGFVVGTDASAEMIAFAKKTFPAKANPNLKFLVCDAREISTKKLGEGFDFIFSNAALHWVDDHEKFLHGASFVLKSGGRLIISCGGKGNAQDVFVALRPEMRLTRWKNYFRKMPTPYFFYAPSDYEKWLPKHGFKINSLKLAPKDATYPSADGFATWLRSTWIPYVQCVPELVGQASSLSSSKLTGKMPVPLENPREEFIAAVTQRYVAKHPPDTENKVHVRMVRLEIEATKA